MLLIDEFAARFVRVGVKAMKQRALLAVGAFDARQVFLRVRAPRALLPLGEFAGGVDCPKC